MCAACDGYAPTVQAKIDDAGRKHAKALAEIRAAEQTGAHWGPDTETGLRGAHWRPTAAPVAAPPRRWGAAA